MVRLLSSVVVWSSADQLDTLSLAEGSPGTPRSRLTAARRTSGESPGLGMLTLEPRHVADSCDLSMEKSSGVSVGVRRTRRGSPGTAGLLVVMLTPANDWPELASVNIQHRCRPLKVTSAQDRPRHLPRAAHTCKNTQQQHSERANLCQGSCNPNRMVWYSRVCDVPLDTV